MQTLGTVLPNQKSLAITDNWFDDKQAKIKKVESQLSGKKKVVLGETRFYKSSKVFQIVGSDCLVREFETKKDGDYFKRFVQI